jgi:hypothetical protein
MILTNIRSTATWRIVIALEGMDIGILQTIAANSR